uniref:Immunity MXAN-0049 protein domain-containing protein n=1 Tax=Caulobacter sp. (strain K31) TaxID=366602 RepID=B0SXS5_CAUSK
MKTRAINSEIMGEEMARIVPEGVYGEEARRMLVQNHPEIQGMALNEVRLIEPVHPLVKGESRFFEIENDSFFQAIEKWKNQPNVDRPIGGGHGLSAIGEMPVFVRENNIIGVPDFFNASNYMKISRRCLDLLRRFDASALEALRIDRRDESGESLGEYYIVDVLRKIPAIDWGDSQIRAEGVRWPLPPHDLRISIGVGNGFRIRSDIEENIHIFRDERNVSSIFISLELKSAMEDAGITGAVYSDPAGLLAVNSEVKL